MKKRILFYTLYTLAAAVFFLYQLFPAEEVSRYIRLSVASAAPGYRLVFDDVKPVIPPGLKLTEADLHKEDRLLARAESLNVIPRLYTLFGKAPELTFDMHSYGGTIKGNLVFSKDEDGGVSGRRISGKTRVDGVRLQEMEAVPAVSEYNITGGLSGYVTYEADGKNLSARGELILDAPSFEPNIPLVKLEQIGFGDVRANFEMADRKMIQITECRAQGNQLNATLSGTVHIRQPFARSTLSLNGTLKPHPTFLARLGDGVGAMLFKRKRGRDEIAFRITGTLESPKFNPR